LTVGGTTNSYSQTAGTTTVDGTLAGNGTAGISVTGGTVQGAGTLKGNVSSSAAINVGDAGKAGLLSITGTYTQLSSGTLNVSVGGTTVGAQYSQLKVTGAASLGGTLTAALVNGFTPTVGQTFTILTAKSISGTFTNSTIAINSTEHFVVSYTSTSVVLTVASGAASTSTNPAAAPMAVATLKSQLVTNKPVTLASTLRHRVGSGATEPVLVASGGRTGNRQRIILAGAVSPIAGHRWEHVPVMPSWNHVRSVEVAVAELPRSVSPSAPRFTLAGSATDSRATQSHTVPVRAPLAGWNGVTNAHRVPVRILTPAFPRTR